MKILLSLILLIIFNAVHAQVHTFERQTDPGFNLLSVLKSPFNNSLYVQQMTFNAGSYFDMAHVDTAGNILNNIAFNTFPYALYTSIPTSSGFISGGFDMSNTSALVSFDYSGNIKWSKSYSYPDGINIRPALVNESDNEIILIGTSTSMTSGNNVFFLIKTDTSGNIISSLLFNYVNSSVSGFSPHDLFRLSNGNYIMILSGWSSPHIIMELDSGFNIISVKRMLTSQSDPFSFRYIKKPDDSFYIVGTFHFGLTRSFVINLTSSFSPIWAYYTMNNISNEGIEFNEAQLTPSGGLIIRGNYMNSDEFYDILLTEIDGSGNFLWAKTIGVAAKSEYAISMVYEPNDAIYMAGGSSDTSSIGNPTNGTYLKTDLFGNTSCYSQSLSILFNNFNIIFNTESINVTPVNVNSTNISFSALPGFTFINTCDGIVSTNEIVINPSVELFPNPAVDELFVRNLDLNEISDYTIYNVLGSMTQSGKFNKDDVKQKINISGLQNGIYFLEIKTNSGGVIKKFVVNR